MKRTINVFLGDGPRLLGVIHYNADGARENAAFEYDASWLAAKDRFTIDPALQLVAGAQFHKRRATVRSSTRPSPTPRLTVGAAGHQP